ncbi:hypothetical protein NLI96_g522 [Meripilus lineatus]|uniref:Uncharacterized protein n=1 Tax=Meripilus lineatus TaxID=2056292 RepID=A0AAD5VC92_9APHY|nr:hypothetical protein NLI96_g522 [Physisporinus lineatus]
METIELDDLSGLCAQANQTTPVFPLEIQLSIIESLLPGSDELENIIEADTRACFNTPCSETSFFWSWSLVCHAWRPICQRAIFSIVFVNNSTGLDKLCQVLRSPTSAHLVQCVRRISVDYSGSVLKLGEALPRIVSMRFPNLIRIDIKVLEMDDVGFPFPHSLLAQVSQLRSVRILHLYGFHFRHIVELRRLLSAFRGLRTAHLYRITFGQDRQGDFRSLRVAPGATVGLCKLESWVEKGDLALSHLWIAPLPTTSESTTPYSSKAVPNRESRSRLFISAPLARFIEDIVVGVAQSDPNTSQSWTWGFEGDNTCILKCTTSLAGSECFKLELPHPSSAHTQDHSDFSFNFSDLKEIKITLEQPLPLDAKHWWWFSELFIELESRVSELASLRKIELYFVSRKVDKLDIDRLDGSDIITQAEEDIYRKKWVQQVVSSLQHMQRGRENLTLIITIDDISLEELLRSEMVVDRERALSFRWGSITNCQCLRSGENTVLALDIDPLTSSHREQGVIQPMLDISSSIIVDRSSRSVRSDHGLPPLEFELVEEKGPCPNSFVPLAPVIVISHSS